MQIKLMMRRTTYFALVVGSLTLLVYLLGDFLWSAKQALVHELASNPTRVATVIRTALWVFTSAVSVVGCLRLGYGWVKRSKKDVSRFKLQRRVTTASEEVRTLLSQVSASSGLFFEASSQEASVLQAVAVQIASLSARTEASSETLVQAMTHMKKTQKQSEHGRKALTDLGTSTKQLEAAGSQLGDLSMQLDAVASQMSQVSAVLIEFRVLALNSAIEAVKAGVHGKGFVAVAGDFTKLTTQFESAFHEMKEQVAQSSREIERLKAGTQEKAQIAQGASEKIDSLFDFMTENLAESAETLNELAVISTAQETEMKAVRHSMNEWMASNQKTSKVAKELSEHLSSAGNLGQSFSVPVTDSVTSAFGWKRAG